MQKLPFIYYLIRGAIGKKFVIKHYRYGIVRTRYPDMSKVVASSAQRQCRNIFKDAVAYARSVNNEAEQKALWKKRVKKGTVYHAAIREYMRVAKERILCVQVVSTKVAAPAIVYEYFYESAECIKVPSERGNNFSHYRETG